MTEKKRITRHDWWNICYAMESHIAEMKEWYANNEMESTKRSIEYNEELLRRLVNTKLSERDKYCSFPDWVEY